MTGSSRACLELTRAISGTHSVHEIYHAALDALKEGLQVDRAAILLFDQGGVMRFVASAGISEEYRRAVEGHSPWQPDTPDPGPIVVRDASTDPALSPYRALFEAEGIRAMAFIPLVSRGRVIGKFMLYYRQPTTVSAERLDLVGVIAAQVAFALERTHAEEAARQAAARLGFALDAACMGTWDWDLGTNTVMWSDNLERIHGLPAGSFDGTFASYAQEIHPDDRAQVAASIERALAGTGDHEVEYRLVAPDDSIRWAEGKGRVEFTDGRPVRMSGVCLIVTRRKEAEMARLEAAHEAARAKDEFLATLSHELRTPLNAILGWLQMLQSGVTPPEQLPEALKIIARNANLQSQLIEDILDVSRIISGKVEVARVPMTLQDLLASAVLGVSPSAVEKGIIVTAAVPPDLPPVSGDGQRLQQVFGNVLSNAVKFTEAGGAISITARAEPDGVVVDIADTGVGIAPDFLPLVFERFRQADSTSTRSHGGLGLGLAIVKHLVDLHGGRIEVSSRGVGLGTTISIMLPAAGAPPAGSAAADLTQGPG